MPGAMSMALSSIFFESGASSFRSIFPSGETIRNASGVSVTPAPLPPPNTGLSGTPFFVLKSEPPEANPKLTFETGMMTVPVGVVTGSPITVFASTISLRFFIEVSITPSSACLCSIFGTSFTVSIL